MREFRLSLHEYSCLIATLRERLSLEHVHELAFLSSEQLARLTDAWEATAVKRLAHIVSEHVGVEKLWRASAQQPGGSCLV